MTGILQGLLASIGGGGPALYTWGYNIFGQLGLNTTGNYQSSPVQVGSETNWSKVGAGKYQSGSIKTNGTLWTWGINGSGQLGDGTTVTKSSPIQVGSLSNWSQVEFGNYFCASIKTDGTLWSWGYNNLGQLGNNSAVSRSSPVQVGSLTDWSQVSGGADHCVSVKTDGTLWTWGYNRFGQLGTGTASLTIFVSSPTQVGALTDWSKISAGGQHCVAIKTDGTLWAWGLNDFNQLGINQNQINKSSPTQIGALTTWSQVSCGYKFSSAVKTDGTLWTWGQAYFGQLGNNNSSINNVSSPIQVGALTNWSKIACGLRHMIAIKTDGTLWAWGSNQRGQIGDSTIVYRSSPVQVGSLTTWSAISCGAKHNVTLEE